MTEAKQPAVFVDGNNVMGSRADGWWRNRAEAAERLVAEIAPLARDSEAAWTIVFDGPGPPVCVAVTNWSTEAAGIAQLRRSKTLPPVAFDPFGDGRWEDVHRGALSTRAAGVPC